MKKVLLSFEQIEAVVEWMNEYIKKDYIELQFRYDFEKLIKEDLEEYLPEPEKDFMIPVPDSQIASGEKGVENTFKTEWSPSGKIEYKPITTIKNEPSGELKWGIIGQPSLAFTCKICGGEQPIHILHDQKSFPIFPLCDQCLTDLNSIVTEKRVKHDIHGPKPGETADEYCKRPTEMKINNPLDERNRKLNLPKD